MVSFSSNSNNRGYGVKEFVVDTRSDIDRINLIDTEPGSTVFIIDTSMWCMLNTQKVWVDISGYNGGGGSGNVNTPNGGNINGNRPIIPTVRYDGGNINF